MGACVLVFQAQDLRRDRECHSLTAEHAKSQLDNAQLTLQFRTNRFKALGHKVGGVDGLVEPVYRATERLLENRNMLFPCCYFVNVEWFILL